MVKLQIFVLDAFARRLQAVTQQQNVLAKFVDRSESLGTFFMFDAPEFHFNYVFVSCLRAYWADAGKKTVNNVPSDSPDGELQTSVNKE